MPITLPLFYKKEPAIPGEQPTTPKRSKTLWIVIAILVNVALAASAIVISKRLKEEEYIPPEEVPAAVEILCKNSIDVALLIDRSGSMDDAGADPPQPITDAKNAAKTFVESINITEDPEETDRVAVVSFADQATLDGSLSNNIVSLNSAIDSISIGDTEAKTNLGAAIKLATEEIENVGRATASKAMVVLSDGVANRGSDGQDCESWPTSHNECTQDAINQAQIAKEAGVSVYTIGLNLDWLEGAFPGTGILAEDTLKQMASGEESYFAALDSSDLESIYIAIAERVCNLGLISGHVFNDWDKDGVWDAEEPALSGWALTSVYEGFPQTTSTDEEGSYTFTNLLPGVYTPSITAQPGWIQTLAPSPTINLPEGETVGNVDFAFYDPNATHLVCQESSCVAVAGGGINECTTDSDCISPTHKTCVGEQCLTISGGGVDTCTTDSDCAYEAARVHKICSNGSCIEVSGGGDDECTSDSDCAMITTETHRECQSSLCAIVSGAGVDECVVNSDCISEQPTGGTTTPYISTSPSASPSAAPDTGRIAPTLAIFVVSLILLSLGAFMAI